MLAGLYNKGVAVLASTSVGKEYGVKPQLEAYLKVTDEALAAARSKMNTIESIQAIPTLKTTLTELADAADALLKDLRADSNMNTLVDMIGNHIGDFASVAAFTEALPEMDSIKAMQQFGSKLIALDNYEQLGNKLSDLQDFSNLKPEDQKNAFKDLDDKTLLNKIVSENSKLNINEVKVYVNKMAEDVCKDLNLEEKESKALIALFNALTTKHLPELNRLRKKLIQELPALLGAEKDRIAKAHPELVVLQHKKPSSILSGFKSKTAANAKSKPKAKTEKVQKTIGKVSKKVHK